jgi:hypothetical protein
MSLLVHSLAAINIRHCCQVSTLHVWHNFGRNYYLSRDSCSCKNVRHLQSAFWIRSLELTGIPLSPFLIYVQSALKVRANKNTTQINLRRCFYYYLAAFCKGSVFPNASASPSRWAGSLLAFPAMHRLMFPLSPSARSNYSTSLLTVYAHSLAHRPVYGSTPIDI